MHEGIGHMVPPPLRQTPLWADTPSEQTPPWVDIPPWQATPLLVNVRAVRILLECILALFEETERPQLCPFVFVLVFILLVFAAHCWLN